MCVIYIFIEVWSRCVSLLRQITTDKRQSLCHCLVNMTKNKKKRITNLTIIGYLLWPRAESRANQPISFLGRKMKVDSLEWFILDSRQFEIYRNAIMQDNFFCFKLRAQTIPPIYKRIKQFTTPLINLLTPISTK